jgi:hypothetical protein
VEEGRVTEVGLGAEKDKKWGMLLRGMEGIEGRDEEREGRV